MSTDKLYSEIKELFEQFEENHTIFKDKGTKAAGGRARKAIGEIKKLASQYRTACLTESKEI